MKRWKEEYEYFAFYYEQDNPTSASKKIYKNLDWQSPYSF